MHENNLTSGGTVSPGAWSLPERPAVTSQAPRTLRSGETCVLLRFTSFSRPTLLFFLCWTHLTLWRGQSGWLGNLWLCFRCDVALGQYLVPSQVVPRVDVWVEGSVSCQLRGAWWPVACRVLRPSPHPGRPASFSGLWSLWARDLGLWWAFSPSGPSSLPQFCGSLNGTPNLLQT